MKKKILLFIIVMSMMFCFVGCSSSTVQTVDNDKKSSMFIEVERASTWKVVYHKDTKVMYTVSCGSSNYGTFTLLVNPDGTPMLYEE